jgi:putative ABC transport system permease protein
MKDSPPNSHFHPEIITTPIDKTFLNDWAWTYFLLSENADPGNIVSGFKEFYSSRDEAKKEEIKTEAFLQKIPDIHLHSNKLREIETNKDMSVIYTLSVAALILLLIALANYTNLNIGMAYYSDKYLFISKVSGSSALMTLKYFLSEGIIIAIASIVLCGIIISLANIVIIKNYTLNLFTSNALWALLIVIIFSLFIILAGILPSLKHVISSIKLTSGYNSNNVKRKGISKSIIVLQYTISIMLIAGVIVIRHQTGYALKSSMGVEDNNLICFENVHSDVQKKFEVFKEELLKFNSVRSVSAMLDPPAGEANDMFRFTMEDYINNETEETDNSIGVLPCDYSFASIFNLKFLGGSNFSENNADNEGSGEYIINKTAMHRLNFTDPDEIIGKRFDLIFNAGDIKIPAGAITGVVEDFHLSSIKKEIEPLVMFKRDTLWLLNFIVSLQPGSETKALDDIKSVWTKLFPHYPFQYKYVSSLYQDLYKTELLQSKLLLIFTLIALFICSMGLLGMSLLTAQRRTKEIGLRKINGAGISEIMIMLNLDLVKWITVSIVIAVPFAFFAMSKWLENFAYRTSLSWWIFALAGLTAMLIALLTVSLQSWSAASRNPVEALRYE